VTLFVGTRIYCVSLGITAEILDIRDSDFGDLLYLVETPDGEQWVHEETVEVA
jgi:hypothetical protein